ADTRAPLYTPLAPLAAIPLFLVVAGKSGRDAQADQQRTAHVALEAQVAAALPPPAARGAGRQRIAGVAREPQHGEHQAQENDLHGHMAAADVDELRQERQEEQRGLGVEQVDDETVAEQPGIAALAGRQVRRADGSGAGADLLQSQPDQVGRAGVLDDAEGQRRRGQQGRQPQRRGHHVHQGGRVDAQVGHQPGLAALFHRLRDDEQHRRTGNDEQHQGGADEQRQACGTGNHEFHGQGSGGGLRVEGRNRYFTAARPRHGNCWLPPDSFHRETHMSNESPRHGVPPQSADHSHTERQSESPLSEGAPIPHTRWDSSGHSGEAAGEPMQAGTGHGVAGDRWRGRAAAHDRGGRSGPPPDDAAHGGYHAHDDPDSGGAHAFHPQPASNSGGYEGTGFNRGYGIEARGYRRSEHHADIGPQ